MNEKFIKSKKYIVIALFLVLAVLSVMLVKNVAINYNISDYLNEDTETKISLEIINREFGAAGSVQVMVEDVDAETANSIKETIASVPNVLSVNFDQYDENYYKDGDALFVALVDGDEYSPVAAKALENIRLALDEKFEGRTNYGGAIVEKAALRAAIESEIKTILLISVVLAAIIMLITSSSWLEPIILLASSGVAILLNMGTNVIFGEISYITNAVAAILQLALAVDYSIVLLHSYRALKDSSSTNEEAMKKAVREVLSPVSASALTTMAGLLALLFMSFRIGFDIGIVLMKGILLSAITSLTLLPALLLLLDKVMCVTKKKPLLFKGNAFCTLAFKASKVVVPVALVLVILCGTLQFGNSYSFTDSKNPNQKINDTFGQNNAIVVVYPNAEDNNAKEAALALKLGEFRTHDGKPVLKNYTAYSNTVAEVYDVKTASGKLNLPEKDVELLLTLYHLYNDSSLVGLTPREFIDTVVELVENDPDVEIEELDPEYIAIAKRALSLYDEVMNDQHTASEIYAIVTRELGYEEELALLAIQQIYGLYFYDSIPDQRISFLDLCQTLKIVAEREELSEYLPPEVADGIDMAIEGINTFNSTYEKLPMAFKRKYQDIYDAVNGRYTYGEVVPALKSTIEGLSGIANIVNIEIPDISDIDVPPELVQQAYILHFNINGQIPDGEIGGRELINFVNDTYPTLSVIDDATKAQIADVMTDVFAIDAVLMNTNKYDYVEMADYINELVTNVKSVELPPITIGAELVSGVYVKHAIYNDLGLSEGVVAYELLDFVAANMETNVLLSSKMDESNRQKVEKAKYDIKRGTTLFIGETYSRMLLSVDLPSEGEDSGIFVEYLTASVKEIFGNDAYVGGEIVSTHDLNVAFDHDNTFITVFTIVAIFLIIMIIFRSFSLPVLLVAVIQGAIWISMSTALITGPMFFMSYIMATCILMGATIDYGILMSTNYVRARETLDKKESLYKAVSAAMPTVFTSGLILTVCGFVVGAIASQNSISTVGWLLGKGTLVSVVMITVVLPAALYLFDSFILKLTLKSKKNDK